MRLLRRWKMTDVKIETRGGMLLRAPLAAISVVEETGSLRAEWDMRHVLIHNPRFPYTVKPGDIKSIQYSR